MTSPDQTGLIERFHRFGQLARSGKFRRIMRLVGLAVLVIGALYSITVLEVDLAQISWGYLALNLAILSPLLLIVAGLTLQITAKALDLDMPFRDALQTAAAANVAELLPLPGGAIVRGAALMRAGAGIADSGLIITLTSVLTLSLTLIVSSGAVVLMGYQIGYVILAVGFLGAASVIWHLHRRVHSKVLIVMIAIRPVTISVSILRLWLSFAALGSSVTLVESALYTVASSLGSSVAIVPGGFGINESIAAALAALVNGSPAATFLAVGLNQALALIAGAVITLGFMWLRPRNDTPV